MIEAQVGALQELARTRIRRGEPDTLPALVPELVDLMAGYRPPPKRLRLASRRPILETDDISSSEEAERAIRGFTLAVAEHGYSGATIHEIVRHASMSPNTFYANFPDKRAVLLAAVDSSTAQLQALAMAAYRRSPGWSTGVRAAIGSALGFLAARPAVATLLLTEVYAGGPEAIRIRADGLGELVGTLAERTQESPGVPTIAPEAIAGGIMALARRQLLRKGAESLPLLAPLATYIALAPYIGAEDACAAANGDGRPGPRRTERRDLLAWP
jgi:TetR/AcrR family transcriptional regulator